MREIVLKGNYGKAGGPDADRNDDRSGAGNDVRGWRMTGPNADIGMLATYIPQCRGPGIHAPPARRHGILATRASSAMRGITGGATLDPPDAAAAARA